MPPSTRQSPPSLRAYAGVCALVLGAVALLDHLEPGLFAAYVGTLPAVPAAFAVCSLGGLAFRHLSERSGYHLFDATISIRARALAMLWTLPFMVAVALADIGLGFPDGIHVAPPVGLLFYPVMGLLAQLALHVVPFVLLLGLLRRAWRSGAAEHHTWVAMVIVSGIECLLQSSGGRATGAALTTFVVVHLMVFGIAELTLFRRLDYLTMYAFRLTYYGFWHVAWGMLRAPSEPRRHHQWNRGAPVRSRCPIG